MISAFFTGVVVAIPTSLVMMKLLNSSLFINNSELRDMNQKISIVINQIDEYDENLYEILEDYVTDTVGSYTALQEFIHDRHANDWIES